MTPADLMRVIGVGKSLIYQYVRGEIDQPREPTLTRIAVALGVSKAWLMHGEISEPSTDLGVAVRRIPILPLQLCGELGVRGQLADLASGEFLPVGNDVGPRSAAVRVEDNSIDSLQPGDMVIVDPDAEPLPGRYVLAVYNGKALIRRYRPLTAQSGGPFELHAEGDDFPMIPSSASPRIVGRIVKRISDF